MAHRAISDAYLLWSEVLFAWALAAYGVNSDPLADESKDFRWRGWMAFYGGRCVLACAAALLVCRSAVLAISLFLSVAVPPWIRYKVPAKRRAEAECAFIMIPAVGLLFIVERLGLAPRSSAASLPISADKLAALLISATSLLLAVRGGTYIVRSFLRKAGTLPQVAAVAAGAQAPPASEAPSAQAAPRVDVSEFNRGRLIGNLERLVLTVALAAGSFAAVGFLLAAKGAIRFDEFAKRDFAEYFLVGSLASILIALCAGLVIRFALLALWPDLLVLQIQSGS